MKIQLVIDFKPSISIEVFNFNNLGIINFDSCNPEIPNSYM